MVTSTTSATRHRAAPEPMRQAFALEEFHHQVRNPGRHPSDVDDVDDVRVADGVRGARLVHEALDQPAILGELAAQDLDGRLAPHERVFGQVDGAHPAFPKQYRHLVVVDRLAYHARATIRPVFEGRVKSLSCRWL